MSDVPALGEPRAFEFLLNAMERAAHEDTPADHGYAEKRRAVFEYVAQLVALATGGAETARNQRIVDLVCAEGSVVKPSTLNPGRVIVIDGRTGLDACERSAAAGFDELFAEADALTPERPADAD